jgi:hypothetical protein
LNFLGFVWKSKLGIHRCTHLDNRGRSISISLPGRFKGRKNLSLSLLVIALKLVQNITQLKTVECLEDVLMRIGCERLNDL